MAVLDKINIIDTSIDMMKEALSLPSSSSLEEVVASITNGGTNEPTNIYRVEFEEDKNALTEMVEDDICVVYRNGVYPISVTTGIPTTWYFPEQVTLETNNNSATLKLGVNVLLAKVYMRLYPDRCTIHAGSSSSGTIVAEYRSEDGGYVYTRVSELDMYEFGGTSFRPTSGQSLTLDSPLMPFICTHDFAFGIYQYLQNNWEYLEIGSNPDLSTIINTTEVYTDNGYQKGTRKEVDYRADYIDWSTAVPDINKGLWVDTGSTTIPAEPYTVHLTSTPLDQFNRMVRTPNGISYSGLAAYKWSSSSSYKKDPCHKVRMVGNGVNDFINHFGIQIDDKVYLIPEQGSSSSTGDYLIDLGTGTISKTGFSYPYGPAAYGNGIKAFYAIDNNTKILICSDHNYWCPDIYDIATSTWTKKIVSYENVVDSDGNVVDITLCDWYVVGDYIYLYYSPTGSTEEDVAARKCYRMSVQSVLDIPSLTETTKAKFTLEKIELDSVIYDNLWRKEKDYIVDSRGNVWNYGICYNGLTLERMTPGTGVGSSEFLDRALTGFYEKNNKMYFIFTNANSFSLTCMGIDLTTYEEIRYQLVIVPDSLSTSRGVVPSGMLHPAVNGKLTWYGGYSYNSTTSSEEGVSDKYSVHFDDLELICRPANTTVLIVQTSTDTQNTNRCEIADGIYTPIQDIMMLNQGGTAYVHTTNIYISSGVDWKKIKGEEETE